MRDVKSVISDLSILMHGVISHPGLTSKDKVIYLE